MMKKITALILLLSTSIVIGEGFYERAPIDYENGKEDNEISRLQEKIDGGLELEHDYENGYLRGVLKALNIPVSTQTLVFSKTSLHRKLINPSKPRALYYNDNSYVGWVDGAKVLEIAVADKNLGAVFYILDQKKNAKPAFERDDTCLSCHASGRTGNEPGFFIRSIFPDKNGEPIARAGEDRVNHTTPFDLRWGGWYVTGENISEKHRGNAWVKEEGKYVLDPTPAVTTNDLSEYFDPDNYPTKTSDVEALMALEHQVEMHNILIQTKFRSVHALHNERVINKALGETGRRDLTKRILNNAANEIIDYMLFVEEVSLGKISFKGTSSFKEDFGKDKPKSSTGRSLYEFDFEKRISKLPCSWLIYGDAFTGLPEELKTLVLQKLKNLLLASELPDQFIHLRQHQQVIHKILMETHKDYQKI
ncbi:MAG: hypothetical protein NE330_19205 [Lentisphaeraceae bacterium]|nr:hypothetical protein [Lentisphaeraceae bacterium]